MFDNVCKFLAENFSADISTWLLGESIELTELSPSELSLEPIRADALILQQSEQVVLHIEFQTEPRPDIPFRMADYRLRVYRRFPQKRMQQVVIYLQPSRSQRVQQNVFVLERTRHEFDVIRLWEQPTEIFLQSPGLMPFAVLSQTSDRLETLQQVAQAISQFSDLRLQSNITASTAILAGLLLEKALIHRILRRDLMQESIIYQDILQTGELSLILRQLNRRVGTVPQEVQLQIQALPLVQLEALGEALLDFSSISDLIHWLQQQPTD
ncbi:Rpn family recombination-promoting nuclease/putative transposase [Egbenema bharatensis]|uniref:Rpn family recombination-promoting nuclease/putative transposase n=1 Tax=Egbenema bharatensis TaxID=3463334 RepID=UPI003A86250E